MKAFRPRFWNLAVKFPLVITAVVTGVGFTIGAVIIYQDWHRFHDELAEKTLLIAGSVAATAPEAMLRNDYWPLFQSLKKVATRPSSDDHPTKVISGMILDTDGAVMAHLNPADHPLALRFKPPDEQEKRLLDTALAAREPIVLSGERRGKAGFLEGVIPIFSDEKYLGVVRIRLSTEELFLKAERGAITVLTVTLGLVVLGSLLGAYISRRMVKPLTAITEGLEAVGRGEVADVPLVPVQNDDELGDLTVAFNRMAVEMGEKKLLEEELVVAEKLAALGRITAGVAHEVNNPLAGLLNCIDTLKKHPDDPEILDRYLPLLDKGLNRIRGIVEGLLVELRVEDASDVSDPSCLDHVRGLIDAEVNGRPIDFVWENALGEDVWLNGTRTQQVLLNLLKNAVQAMPDGGKVAFRSYQDAGGVILEVEDNGPGIPKEYRNQLFDPFFTTKPTGTGLGLWIVYRLVESMRGVIDVDSEVGTGTRFRITLPVMEGPRE